ncbi:MAG: flavin-dependent dehydrogenase, partial [Limnothrix sp. RL_2_0]|nr:flavin-dependent dehydrogenase [Limnothrix sp. RL_2_0]
MEELLYIEVPTPDTEKVCHWLQQSWEVDGVAKASTPDGVQLIAEGKELAVFTWSVQRTTYVKVFGWDDGFPQAKGICRALTAALRQEYPNRYPVPPEIKTGESI